MNIIETRDVGDCEGCKALEYERATAEQVGRKAVEQAQAYSTELKEEQAARRDAERGLAVVANKLADVEEKLGGWMIFVAGMELQRDQLRKQVLGLTMERDELRGELERLSDSAQQMLIERTQLRKLVSDLTIGNGRLMEEAAGLREHRDSLQAQLIHTFDPSGFHQPRSETRANALEEAAQLVEREALRSDIAALIRALKGEVHQ